MPVRRAILLVSLLSLLSLLAACSSPSPTAGFGEACEGSAACKSGRCVSEGSTRRGTCTRTCGPQTPCPDGWSCSALTSQGVAVCARGSGVPELQLNGPRN